MRAKRCTKCKWFRHSRKKERFYDHGKGYSMSAESLIDGISDYYCKNRWWNVISLKQFKEGDVCEDFEFK